METCDTKFKLCTKFNLVLYDNQQYFISRDHKFRIIFIMTSPLTVLSVFNRLTELFSGHVTRSSYYKKKVSFHLRMESRDLGGNVCATADVVFSCFLGIFARSCWLRNCIWKKCLTESLCHGATEPWLQLWRHHLKSSQQGLLSVHHQRFIKLLQNLGLPPQQLGCTTHKQFFNTTNIKVAN